MDVVLEELAALVVLAGPAPHVLAVAGGLAAVQDAGADEPHDDAEHEPADGEHGVVDGDFLGALVASSAVGEHDENGEQKRHAGDAEDDDLRPEFLLGCPGGEVVSVGEVGRRVEDGEDC